MPKLDIDHLLPSKSLIDLTGLPANSLDSALIGFDLEHVLDDIVFIEFTDVLGGNSNEIIRNGLVVPINAATNAWRIGKAVLVGKGCILVKKGDYVCFPNNMGINISKINVVGHGLVDNGQFLNEHRIFGVVKPNRKDANNTSKPSRRTKK